MAGKFNQNYDNVYPFSKMNQRKAETEAFSMDIIGNRVPPHSSEAEAAVLGALMLDSAAITKVIDIITPDSFYNQNHRIIFETILQMFEKRIPVDIVTLGEELARRGLLQAIGGAYFLMELSNKTPTSANVEQHARIMQERFIKRELIRTAGVIMANCYDETTDALEEIDNAESEIFKLSDKRFQKTYLPINRIAMQTMDLIAKTMEYDNKLTGVPTGFKMLDDLLGGFQKSDFIVIAGRPSMGKTALALSIARNVAVEYKKSVAFFSIEMDGVQLVMRLLSAEAKINGNSIRVGRINTDSFQKLAKSIGRIAEAPIVIDDSPSLTILELRAKCRRLINDHKIDMVMVDYLQLMHAPKTESREREISMISQSFKQLAKELKIPIVALAQLNRTVESRQDKRPLLSDLRESGSIEQDADVVLFIHRPEYYKIMTYDDNKPTKGTAEIIIGKHRNGPIGTARVAYLEDYARFENLSFQYENEPDFAPGDDVEEEDVF